MLENIKIRLLKKKDTENYFRLIESNRDRLKRYFPITVAETIDLEACTAYIKKKRKQAKKRKTFLYVIFTDGRLCGVLILKNIDWRIPKGELAYYVDRDYEGKGIMSKAMKWLMRHCFQELGMNKLFIKLSPRNGPSRRLTLRNGFQLEGLLRKEFRIETGEIEDIEYYGKLK